ncbi:MAG: hypothetical protein G01um101425_736 [Candidatus Peregrinibacteria bacterium Gr01-1014_25]|nr:MAG: hypothetical protein G01um101425_736 [Candidatus Peregrinibacteria bacterium Gr01-1014_25]
MQRITLLCIGHPKARWIEAGCEEYLRRFGRDIDVQVVEIADSRERDPQRQVADESVRLLIAADRFPGQRWILDERGLRVTSPAFAELIGKARDRGDKLTFLLGGAYGVNDAVRQSGQLLRLSDMTFPHELCRLVFLEQLYRAGEIAKGSGYHHEGFGSRVRG